MSTNTLPERKNVPLEDTWKLEDIFENDTTCIEKFGEAKVFIEACKEFKDKLLSTPQTLLQGILAEEKASLVVSKIYLYTHMRLHQDGGNSTYQDLSNRSESLRIALSSATSFYEPELSLLTSEQLESFMKEEPGLKVYERFFQELLRTKEHILDAEIEQLLSEFGEVTVAPSNIFSMFNNADISFPTIENETGEKIQITHGRYIQFLESKDARVRKDAFEGVYSTYAKMKNTLATTFAANIKQYDLLAKVRKYPSPLHAALDRNNIPTSVYENLIETVHANLDGMHAYMGLRKEMLSLDELHMYDLYMPMVQEFDKKIPYEEAVDTILKALEPLGEDYIALLKEGFENRWIDKYENKGKRSGAYSWGTYGLSHPYVLMNYVENVNNMFTLAHEMGHALHSYLSSRIQPQVYSGYCIFVAEVASTVNEALLMQYLLKTTTDPVYKKYLINYFMEQFRTTLYRQTMFAEFEKKVHEMNVSGQTLTADVLSQTYYDLVKKYHGENVAVDQAIEMEWSRIPHFYTPFYVYQYATGYSAAVALSQRILKEGKDAVKDYKAFLSGGSSKDPIDLLKLAGVDMSSPKPIEDALVVFKDLINQMKELNR
jgi:oligoendopeptidase F